MFSTIFRLFITSNQLMKYLKTSLIIIFLVLMACEPAPSSEEHGNLKKWYKGNLHTHSYWSDGDEFPEMIMDWYKQKGYHFLALSDHNILAEGDKWITISEEDTRRKSFSDYLSDYGADWVQQRTTSGQMEVKLKTLAEYRSRFEEEEKFLIIQSEEITDQFEDKPVHLNATNIQSLIEPQGGNSVADVMQRNIDAVHEQRSQTGVPILPHVNHPNFGYAVAIEDMIALDRERFFEVYNGHPQVHNLGDSLHMSTEDMWDLINISYLAEGKPIMFGLATDDAHHYHTKGKKWSNAGRGWIMVQASSLSVEALIGAMESGAFYASTGVTLQEILFDGGKLSIEVDPEPNVSYQIEFIGCKKGSSASELLESHTGKTASYILTDDILFVRGRITSTKRQDNPIEDFVYEMAWTQPLVGK